MSRPPDTDRHSRRWGVLLAAARAPGLLAATLTLLLIGAAGPYADLAQAVPAWTTTQAPPMPAGATSSVLSGVSCPSASGCIAVGSYVNSAGSRMTLAEAWNGTNWSIQTTLNPTANSVLSSVSCTAANACTAVGASVNSSGAEATLAESWDGNTWSIQQSPTPPGGATFSGVSCVGATCTAVGGTSQNTPLAEQWTTSGGWVIPAAAPAGGGVFSSVSCTGASACYAVGSSGRGALAEQWNGTTWTIQSTPNPLPAGIWNGGSSLSGVSCLSTTNCVAVGQWSGWRCTGSVCNCLKYPCSHVQEPVTESLNGTTWTIMPNSLTIGALAGVSCAATTACAAVGTINSTGPTYALEDDWTGSSWLYAEVPANPYGDLLGVSCATATTCLAVGQGHPAPYTAAWTALAVLSS